MSGDPLLHGLAVLGLTWPFAWITVRTRVLTRGGALMAGCIALCVVLGQGWAALVPLFLFLLSGVALGRLNRKARTDAKHGRPRDAVQVFCNGGIYALLAVFGGFHADLWMAISICTATCDTWASEIGLYARWPTVDIVRWRRVSPGLSGGISLAGTLGGIAGALCMGICIAALATAPTHGHGLLLTAFSASLTFAAALLYATFAVGGMLLDSVLGAVLQVKYNDGDGLQDSGTRMAAGLPWMTNDLVNLLSNALTVVAARVLLR